MSEISLLTYKKLTPEEERKLDALNREKAIRDMKSMIEEGEIRGRAEGREEGRVEERAATIEKLRAMGMTEEEIRDFYSE